MEMISISKYKILCKKLKINNIYNNFIINLIKEKIDLSYIDHFYINKINNFIINNINLLYIVITTDQGLCGNINYLLFNKLLIRINKKNNSNLFLLLIGKKSISFVNTLKENKIKFILLEKICSIHFFLKEIHFYIKMINSFLEKNNKTKVYIVSNDIKKKIFFSPKIKKILPLNSINKSKEKILNYEFEYDLYKSNLVNIIFYKYIHSILFNRVLTNMVVEYFTRILIMKNASINTDNLFKKLNILYNKLRQFNITREITELVSNL